MTRPRASQASRGIARNSRSLLGFIRVAWAVLRGASLPTIQSKLYDLVYASPVVRDVRFFNYGYHPLAPDLHDMAGFLGEPFQTNLYHHVLMSARKQLGHVPRAMVEVACSRAGGLLYASRLFPEIEFLLGIDLQPDAVTAAKAMCLAESRLAFVAASGHSLPLRALSVNLLVCVEALMNLDRTRFLQEAVRVLLPKGVLATTGSHFGSFENAHSELVAQTQACGLILTQMIDITANIVAACEQDAPRRQQLVAKAPWFSRHYLRNFLGLPGGKKYLAYQSGERCYYLAVMQRS